LTAGCPEDTACRVCPPLVIGISAFPFGPFQLTVRVTDKRTKQITFQEARFVVVP